MNLNPVQQALNLSLSGFFEWLKGDAKSPTRLNYALNDGHFKIYLTKGFTGNPPEEDGDPDEDQDAALRGWATRLNTAHGIVLVIDLATGFLPSGVG